jgi:hypothetical protein
MDMHLIWVRRKRKYFCKRGWTGKPAKHELICPSGKINGHVGWVEPFAKPITVVQSMMGIASAFALRATADKSLHPSYALERKARETLMVTSP